MGVSFNPIFKDIHTFFKYTNMKLIYLTCFAAIKASKESMNSSIIKIIKADADGTANVDDTTKAEARSVSVTLGDDAMSNLEDYGCWCYFDDKHGTGKGAPVDAVDAMCKNLAQAYDCAMMDYADATGNDDCVPWEVSYNAGISFGIGALVDTCNQVNANDLCAQYACMAEGSFIINIISAFLNIGTVNPAHKHDNGFDIRASCPVNSGSQTDERQCCGILPFRYPYKPVDKECCGAATYDPSLMECCSDNIPKFSCV